MRRLFVAVAVLLAAVTTAAQTLITPTAPGPWQFQSAGGPPAAPPAAYIAPGFDTPPLGIGSVHLAVGSDGNASAQARNTAYAGTLLSDLTALSYSTYIDVNGSTNDQAPYLNLLIDQDNNGTVDDQLFFEPAYQTGAYSGDPVPNQGAVAPHTWQTWDALVGGWWSLDALTFGPPLVTLATYVASFPNARIVNNSSGFGGVRILTGGGAGAWDNFLGGADNVTIDTATTASVTYNFEPDAGTVVTVTTTTPGIWSLQTVDDGDATNTATIDIVAGPATPPLGTGSLQLAVGADGDDAAQARTTNWDGQLVRDISSLTYWTYVQQDGSGGQAPYLILDVDYNGDNVRDDLLFFEPLYQSATYFPSDPQAALVTGAWQQWDARDGGWYSVNGVAGSGPGTNVVPLSDILDVEPDARLTGSNGGGVRIVAGFGAGAWDNFIGNADAFAISFVSPVTTYDFEPIPSIIIGDVSQNEGTGGTTNFTFTLTLSSPVSQSVTVNYSTADNSATAADADYTPVVSGTATFSPQSTTTTITIVVNPDTKFEPNEDFFVNLTTPQFATIADPQAVGTILNDDSQPTINIGDYSAAEGDAGTTAFTFNVTLSNPSSLPVSITWTTAPDTATAPSDFIADTDTLIIPAGSTAGTITVDVVGDTVSEPDETFFVNLTGATNGTIADGQGIGTIVNQDPIPSATINDVPLAEGNAGTTAFTFTVLLSNASSTPISITWSTANGTAVAPGDYTADADTLIIPAGSTSGTITVDVIGDLVLEPDETFFVNLTGATGANITDNQGLGTIVNDEGVPTATIDDVTLNEGNAGTTPFVFTVTLSGPSATPVSINYTTAPNTATSPADFTAETDTLVIPALALTGTITIDVIGETAFEANETFFVNLTGATGAAIADPQGLGTIVNDDQPAADVSVAKTAPATVSPGAPVTYTITVTNAGPQSASNVTVTDVLPAGTTFVSATPSQGTCSGTTTVTCTLGAIAANGNATIALTVNAPLTPTTLSNSATVTNTPEIDPTPGNNTSPGTITIVGAAAAGIPTVSEWGLLALLAGLLGLAFVRLR